jgi:hypothetical protein
VLGRRNFCFVSSLFGSLVGRRTVFAQVCGREYYAGTKRLPGIVYGLFYFSWKKSRKAKKEK